MSENYFGRFLKRLVSYRRPWIWVIGLFVLYHLSLSFIAPIVAKHQINKFAEQHLGLNSSISELKINPYRFTVLVENFELADEQTLIAFDRLYVNAHPTGYLGSKQIEVGEFNLSGLTTRLERFEDGSTNIEQLMQRLEETAPEDNEPEPVAEETEAQPINLLVSLLSINDASIQIVDSLPSENLQLTVQDIELQLTNLSSIADQIAELDFSFGLSSGGNISTTGTLGLTPDFNSQIRLSIEELALQPLQAYLAEATQIQLVSGNINSQANLSINAEENFAYQGSVSLEQLDIQYQDQQLLAWNSLSLPENTFSISQNQLTISEILIQQPYFRAEIARDGSMNISQALSSTENSETDSSEVDSASVEPIAEEISTETQAAENPLAIEVDQIQINQAAMYFADFTLPLPFIANITDLEGQISTISNVSSAPAVLDLEGQVGEFGLVEMSGQLRPLQPKQLTELDLSFENVEMLDLSPYLIKFAGRAIESGKLDVELSYAIDNSQLQGNNSMVMRDFTLGERVESPDALNLPLGLAIALLKNSDGVIDLELPVAGDLDNPEFSYGGIIRTALTNIITNIVSSPFRFLGGLIGSEEPLDNIEYQPGSSELRPPQREKLVQLSEALLQRPQLSLQITPVYDTELDRPVIQQQMLEQQLQSELAAQQQADSNTLTDRVAALESLSQAYLDNLQLEALRTANTVTNEASESQLDELAYFNALQQRLIENQQVTDAQFEELARQRAEIVRSYLIETQASLSERISVLSNISNELQESENVILSLSLESL